MPILDDNIQYLKGVGPALAKKFAKLGVHTVRDLLFHYPRRYVDYTRPYAVAEAPYDVDCCVRAEVLQKEPARRIKGGRVLTRVLAAKSQEKPQIARVVAVGPGGEVDGKEVKMYLKVGDRVISAKYSGTEVKIDGEEYTIVKQSDILAVVE